MKYLLNALVPGPSGVPMTPYGPVPLEEALPAVREWARGAACFIGHPATAELLGVPPSRGEARPQAGDVAVVVRLRSRATRPGDVAVRASDLEAWFVVYGWEDSLEPPPWQ